MQTTVAVKSSKKKHIQLEPQENNPHRCARRRYIESLDELRYKYENNIQSQYILLSIIYHYHTLIRDQLICPACSFSFPIHSSTLPQLHNFPSLKKFSGMQIKFSVMQIKKFCSTVAPDLIHFWSPRCHTKCFIQVFTLWALWKYLINQKSIITVSFLLRYNGTIYTTCYHFSEF